MCLPATLLHAALSTEPEVSGRSSFAGQLLIASPDLRQPAFDHAVILLAQHSRGGALGIVINRPVGDRPLASILAALDRALEAMAATIRPFIRGRVRQLDQSRAVAPGE